MGRPPKDGETRTANVLLRVLETERDAWKRAAKAKKLSVSEWLRDLANRAAAKVKR